MIRLQSVICVACKNQGIVSLDRCHRGSHR